MPKRFACDSPGGGHLGLFGEAVGIKVVVRCNVIMRNPTTTLILTGAGDFIFQLGLRVHNGTGGHILVVGCTVFGELGKQLVRYPSVQLPRHVPSIYDAPFFTTTTPRLAPEANIWISVPNNAAFGILHFHRICGPYQALMQYAEEVRLRFSGVRPFWTVR